MSKQHVVACGESIESIAFTYGHFGTTIWDHPANKPLKDLRRDPDVLAAGDIVFIPDLRERVTEAALNRRYRFRRRGVPSVLRLRPLVFGRPLVSEPFRLQVDDLPPVAGSLGEDGVISCYVPPNAVRATLTVGSGHLQFTYELSLRGLEPAETPLGLQQRLNQLGFISKPMDGSEGAATTGAIAQFQEHYGLPATGRPDDRTISTLLRENGR